MNIYRNFNLFKTTVCLVVLFAICCEAAYPSSKPLSGNFYNIKVKLSGLKEQTVIELLVIRPGSERRINISKVHNNTVEFKGVCDHIELAQLAFHKSELFIDFVLAPGNSFINGNSMNKGSITYTGNQEISAYQQGYYKMLVWGSKILKLDNKHVVLNSEMELRKKDVALFKTQKEIGEQVQSFIKTHPNNYASIVVLWFLQDRLYNNIDAAKGFTYLSDENKKSYLKFTSKGDFSDPPSEKINTVQKDFAQTDTVGKMISLKDFRGKYVLIDFWAAWCGPCMHEMPTVVSANRLFKDKNLAIVGVSLDDSKENWLGTIRREHLNWIQLSDLKGWKNKVAVANDITSIPQNILVDPTGKVVAVNMRGFDLLYTLAQHLGDPN